MAGSGPGMAAECTYWLGLVILAGALILPDIAGFAIGGFRLDLKQAQDEIATLRQEVNARLPGEIRPSPT
jgi:hypothetical protein